MKISVLGVHGSPRRGNTEKALQEALKIAGEIEGVETYGAPLRDPEIHPCIHCNRCMEPEVFHCPVFKDGMEDLYPRVREADVLIIASPVYHMAPSAQTMAFINRLRPLGKLTSMGGWAAKVGCGIAVGGTRNGGEESVLDVINRFFLCSGMCIAGGGVYAYSGASFWSGHGEGGAATDETGGKTLYISVRRAVLTARLIKRGLAGESLYTGCRLAGFADEEERDRYLSAFKRG